jgi:hypothetical protein
MRRTPLQAPLRYAQSDDGRSQLGSLSDPNGSWSENRDPDGQVLRNAFYLSERQIPWMGFSMSTLSPSTH